MNLSDLLQYLIQKERESDQNRYCLLLVTKYLRLNGITNYTHYTPIAVFSTMEDLNSNLRYKQTRSGLLELGAYNRSVSVESLNEKMYLAVRIIQ